MNILHRQVTRFTAVTNTTPQGTVILFDYLTQPDPSITPLLQRVRESKSPEELKANKKLLPCITPHGTFRQRNDSGLIAHSGLIQIDMDRKDNTDILNWESIPDILKLDQHIAYVGKSASGSSFWGLIPIEDPDCHSGHWEAIQEHFRIQYGITLDPCTKALPHPRFYAYDPDGYVNPDAVTFTKRIKAEPVQHRTQVRTDLRDMDKFNAYIRDICDTKTDITGGLKQWMKVGTAIKSELGPSGEDAFIDICQFSPTFSEAECRRTYRTLKPQKLTLGTFYFICRKYGIEPEEYRPRRRIHRPRRPDPAPTSQKEDASPMWTVTGIQIARWMDERPEESQPEDRGIPVCELIQEPDSDGSIIYVVEEHNYSQPLPSPTFSQRMSVLRKSVDAITDDHPPVQLYPWMTVTDTRKFIDGHMELLNSCSERPIYHPYLERMEHFVAVIQK